MEVTNHNKAVAVECEKFKTKALHSSITIPIKKKIDQTQLQKNPCDSAIAGKSAWPVSSSYVFSSDWLNR